MNLVFACSFGKKLKFWKHTFSAISHDLRVCLILSVLIPSDSVTQDPILSWIYPFLDCLLFCNVESIYNLFKLCISASKLCIVSIFLKVSVSLHKAVTYYYLNGSWTSTLESNMASGGHIRVRSWNNGVRCMSLYILLDCIGLGKM